MPNLKGLAQQQQQQQQQQQRMRQKPTQPMQDCMALHIRSSATDKLVMVTAKQEAWRKLSVSGGAGTYVLEPLLLIQEAVIFPQQNTSYARLHGALCPHATR
jgi:hypothetical protein